MNESANCPTPLELQRMLRGEVSDRRLEEIARHLADCSICSDNVQRIPEDDELRNAIRNQTQLIRTDGAVLQAIAKACAIFQSPDSQQDTVRDSLDETVPAEETIKSFTFLAPPELPDEIGRLGKYRILEILGQGGMGVVFRANDPLLNRDVALKVLWMAKPLSASLKQRFLREARALASVDHPNVVPVYAVEDDGPVPFLTMKLLKGQTLAERLHGGPLNESAIVPIGKQLASALAAAHQAGVIHRDIKPANIWIEESGEAKLIDFGLARTDDLELTVTGNIVGTPKYMSPEQVNGQPATEQSDLFSLGCVLYHAVAGKPPFEKPNLPSLMRAIAEGDFQSLEKAAPIAAPEISGVVHKLLKVDSTERYHSAEALVDDLSQLRLSNTATDASPPHQSQDNPAPSSHRFKFGIWLLCGLLLSSIAAGVIITLRDKDGNITGRIHSSANSVEVQGDRDTRITVHDDVESHQAEHVVINLVDAFTTTQGKNGLTYLSVGDTRPRDAQASSNLISQISPLRLSTDAKLPNGSDTITGPMFVGQGDILPLVAKDRSRSLLLLHPEVGDAGAQAAGVEYTIPTSGQVHVRGSFARANDATKSGEGVDIGIFINRNLAAPLFSGKITSNHKVDVDAVFDGSGTIPFDFRVNVDVGDQILFAVFSDAQGVDSSFDLTALEAAISHHPLPDLQNKPAQISATERAILDWVFSVGGSVISHQDNDSGGYTATTAVTSSQLPLGKWRFHGIELQNVTELPSVLSQYPSELEHLNLVSFKESSVSEAMLETIGMLESAKVLVFDDCSLVTSGLKHLAHLPRLDEIKFRNTRIDTKGLSYLTSTPLRRFTITQQDISIEQLKLLQKSHLERLAIFSVPMTKEHLDVVAKMTTLKELVLQDTKITIEGLDQLGQLTSVEHLDLSRNSIGADAIVLLQKQLPNCQIIWDENSNTTTHYEREVASWLLRTGGSVTLQIDGLPGRQEFGPAEIGGLPKATFFIRRATIRKENVRDHELHNLARLTQQVDVYFDGQGITGECFQTMPPLLGTLQLQGCRSLVSSNLKHLRSQKHLESILALDSNLGDDLAMLAKDVPTLRSVEFGNELTNQGLANLRGCESLTTIHVAKCHRITPDGFEYLRDIPNLQTLLIDERQLASQRTMEQIAKLTSLTALQVLALHDDDLRLNNLARCDQIEVLNLSYQSLRGLDLGQLAKIEKMSKLIVLETDLTAADLVKLREQLPECEIISHE